MTAVYGSLPFNEQIEFFRKKLNLPTQSWTDVYGAEHDWAFMVAGANRDDLVLAFRDAVERAINSGETLEQFRQRFDRIVTEFGWDYNGGRNWRSRVIYETNLFSSYSAGRYQQLYAMREHLPYWQYHHSDAVEHPREDHLAWDGMILRWDDPWWQYHFPINAWGCQCSVTALSEFDLQMMGRSVDTAPTIEWEERVIGQRSPDGPRTVRVPKGVDPGFEHVPGQSRLISKIPPELPETPTGSSGAPGVPNRAALDPLPAPRKLDSSLLLPENLSDMEYAQAFLEQFGASVDKPVVYQDVLGDRLVLGVELFKNRKTGQLKSNKNQRGKFLKIIAKAITSPDEIWVRVEHMASQAKLVLRRRYLARFQLPEQDVPSLAVFEISESGWTGITVFSGRDDNYLEDQRIGVRLYRRKQD